MPYKVHKMANGKYKAYRQAEGGRPARPLSNHPQSAETAKKQIAAIHANEGPENHSAGDCVGSGGMTGGSMSGGTYSLSSGSQPGMWKLTRKKKLESYAAPPNKSELISKLKLGERQKKKLDMMADVSNEARDPSGKWTSGGNSGGGQGKVVQGPHGPVNLSPPSSSGKVRGTPVNAPVSAGGKPASSSPSSLSSSLPKVSSGISPEKKAQIAAKTQASQTRTVSDPRQANQGAPSPAPVTDVQGREHTGSGGWPKGISNWAEDVSPKSQPIAGSQGATQSPIDRIKPGGSYNFGDDPNQPGYHHLNPSQKQAFDKHVQDTYGMPAYAAGKYFASKEGKAAFAPEYSHFLANNPGAKKPIDPQGASSPSKVGPFGPPSPSGKIMRPRAGSEGPKLSTDETMKILADRRNAEIKAHDAAPKKKNE